MSLSLYHPSRQASTRTTRVKGVPFQWTGLDPSLGGNGFLSSWLQDRREGEDHARRGINWGAVWGMAVAFAFSAGFWAGLGLLISRFV